MNITEFLTKDIEWRMSELASLKSIPLRYKLLSHHQEMLVKYTIPSVYALWEGFVRLAFKQYVSLINSKKLSADELHINLLTHGITSIDKLRLENPRTSFESKKEFTEKYLALVGKSIKIPEEIPTQSNVNFQVINKILTIFNLELLPKQFDKPLGKLLTFRNSIAHGEVLIPVKLKDVQYFTQLLNDLMIEIVLRIEKGINSNSYLR